MWFWEIRKRRPEIAGFLVDFPSGFFEHYFVDDHRTLNIRCLSLIMTFSSKHSSLFKEIIKRLATHLFSTDFSATKTPQLPEQIIKSSRSQINGKKAALWDRSNNLVPRNLFVFSHREFSMLFLTSLMLDCATWKLKHVELFWSNILSGFWRFFGEFSGAFIRNFLGRK